MRISSTNLVRTVTALLLTLILWASSSLGKENTVDDFFRPAKIGSVSLAPDGEFLAGLAPIDKGSEIGMVILNLETLEPRAFDWGSGFDIYDFDWVSNEDLIFRVGRWNSYVAGAFRIGREKTSKAHTIFDNTIVAEILDPMPEHDRHSWVWIRGSIDGKSGIAKLRKFDTSKRMGVGRSEYNNGEVLEEWENVPKGQVSGFITDWIGKLRLALRYEDNRLEYLHRDHRDDDWSPLNLDAEDWEVVSFGRDNETLYVVGYGGEDTMGLYTYDKENDQIGDLIYRDDFYDFPETARYKFVADQLVGISYHRSSPASVWFDAGIEQVQGQINELLPGRSNWIQDWDDSFTKLLIRSVSDVAPAQYFLLNMKERSFKIVSDTAPWIDAKELAKTEVMRFKTSDGLTLEAYLTRPNKGKGPFPTVCLVHGGPWARDTGLYDGESQYLASLGYAVLRVNYRGSSGFGKRVSLDEAYAFREMQDDITKAVEVLVKAKVADPERLAIMGGSFGGYSALCGAAFEPDLYKCAVTIVGVFDWQEMVKSRKRQRSKYSYSKLVEELGDPSNAEAFEAISPIKHVDKIKIPIFIAHGKSDRNVSVRQSKMLQAALKKNKVPHETFYRAWEGHGFFDQKNRIELYKQIGAFLKKYL